MKTTTARLANGEAVEVEILTGDGTPIARGRDARRRARRPIPAPVKRALVTAQRAPADPFERLALDVLRRLLR